MINKVNNSISSKFEILLLLSSINEKTKYGDKLRLRNPKKEQIIISNYL